MFGSKSFNLPAGLQLIEFENKIRFKGTAEQLDNLVIELRKSSKLENNKTVNLGKFQIFISDNTPTNLDNNTIQLPSHALNIMASKFSEVANSWEDSPLDFNDCGYLFPKLEFDIGVELVGEANPR